MGGGRRKKMIGDVGPVARKRAIEKKKMRRMLDQTCPLFLGQSLGQAHWPMLLLSSGAKVTQKVVNRLCWCFKAILNFLIDLI